MKDIKVLFIVSSNAGVGYWRVSNFVHAAYRNRAGFFHAPWYDKSIQENHPWEMDIADSLYKKRILAELWDHGQKADVIVFQMVHTGAALELFMSMKLALPHVPIVTEIDDHVLSTPTYNPADSAYGPGGYCRDIAIEQFKYSDAMIVSTPYLKEVYAEFCENIYVVPNSLDFRIWDNLRHRKNKDFIKIGWCGGASHEEDLRIIEPVVHKILAKYKNVRFCLVHGIPPFLRDIERVEEFRAFTRIDRYPQMMASRGFDIGLAPLVDNSFNRAKSNLRWLEYSGLKIPTVASNVGHFKETIEHGVDGLLCETEEEWISSLSGLIENEEKRRLMAKAANQKARKLFNVDLTVWDYSKYLGEIAERGQVVKVKDDLQEVQEANA